MPRFSNEKVINFPSPAFFNFDFLQIKDYKILCVGGFPLRSQLLLNKTLTICLLENNQDGRGSEGLGSEGLEDQRV